MCHQSGCDATGSAEKQTAAERRSASAIVHEEDAGHSGRDLDDPAKEKSLFFYVNVDKVARYIRWKLVVEVQVSGQVGRVHRQSIVSHDDCHPAQNRLKCKV